MGKLRVLSGRQVCQILARHGFVEVRRRGSHVAMQKNILGRTTTVPVTSSDIGNSFLYIHRLRESQKGTNSTKLFSMAKLRVGISPDL